MSSARITYTLRLDVMPESELNVLAAAYAFILQCHDEKKAAEGNGGEDDRKGVEDVPAKSSIP